MFGFFNRTTIGKRVFLYLTLCYHITYVVHGSLYSKLYSVVKFQLWWKQRIERLQQRGERDVSEARCFQATSKVGDLRPTLSPLARCWNSTARPGDGLAFPELPGHVLAEAFRQRRRIGNDPVTVRPAPLRPVGRGCTGPARQQKHGKCPGNQGHAFHDDLPPWRAAFMLPSQSCGRGRGSAGSFRAARRSARHGR